VTWWDQAGRALIGIAMVLMAITFLPLAYRRWQGSPVLVSGASGTTN
jgi:hypothetical protein